MLTQEQKQELFNKSYGGLKAQNFQFSIGRTPQEGDRCAYRSPDGKKCAIGHLIVDEYYNPIIEGHSIPTPTVRTIVEKSQNIVIGGVDLVFLNTLQQCHDDAFRFKEINHMESNLMKFAERFNLVIPE